MLTSKISLVVYMLTSSMHVQTECFLLHARAHSSGLNLVNATHIFLCEPLINTAIELQAIARAHRIGQQRPTTVWMYLVSGTVEESIYDVSVTRRLDHIVDATKKKELPSAEAEENDKGIVENLTEAAIDSANSMELQDAPLSKLVAAGRGSDGEFVHKSDLWECLFGNADRRVKNEYSDEAQRTVGRFLRGEAAERRAAEASR